MKVEVEAFGATDIGQRRDNNEDQFFIGELSGSMKVQHTSVAIDNCSTVFGETQGHIFLVADGVGGHVAGEKASALAIAAVSSHALNNLQWLIRNESHEDDAEKLQAFAAECQKRLVEAARKHPSQRGMATTLTLAIVVWPKLYLIHIGDSRCYLLRDKKLEQLTRDHTLGQLYSEFDEVPVGQGANHALWNVVSSEGNAPPVADIVQRELTTNDQLLLCTDGLYDHFEESELANIASTAQSPKDACELFVNQANERGGHDNITVIVSRFHRCEKLCETKVMVETRRPIEEMLKTEDSAYDLHDTDEFIHQSLEEK